MTTTIRDLAPDDPRHGTFNGYRNLRCRCDACREANRQQMIAERQRRRRQGLAADDPRHGTNSTYVNWACRCDACRAGHVETRRLQRQAAKTLTA